MRYSDEAIARVCHEAIRGLQAVQGDPHPADPWDAASPEMRKFAVEGVRAARNGASPRELHEEWVLFKHEHGWRFGDVKDEVAKTHPCLVDYAELPQGQRDKDALFHAIVAVLGSQL